MPNTIAISGVISKAAQLAHSMGLIFNYWKRRGPAEWKGRREDKKQRKNHLKTSLLTTYYILLTITPALLLTTSLFSQEHDGPASRRDGYRHYTVQNGLPSGTIFHTMQDSRGYLWISTENGVSRYNGYEFQNFTTRDGLMDNYTYFSHEDKKGRIWFVSISPELSYYSYEDGKIHPYGFNESIARLSMKRHYRMSMVVDGDEIYVGNWRDGYYHIDAGGNAEHITNAPGMYLLSMENGILIYENNDEDNIGYKSLPPYGKQPQTVHVDNRPCYFGYPIIRGGQELFKLKSGIFMRYFNGIFQLKGDTFELVRKEPESVTRIFQNKKHILVSYSRGERGYRLYTDLTNTADHAPNLLPEITVKSFHVDHENNLWLSADEGLIFKADNPHIEQKINPDNTLPREGVFKIIADEDDIVYALFQNNEIWEIDRDHMNSKRLKVVNRFPQFLPPLHFDLKTKQLLTQNELNALFNSAYFNTHGHSFPYSFQVQYVVDEDDSIYWMFLENGIYRIVNGSITDVINRETVISNAKDLVIDQFYVNTALADGQGSLLFASPTFGFVQYNGKELMVLDKKYMQFKGRIVDIARYDDTTLLFTNSGEGLVIWLGDSIYTLNEGDGLSSNAIDKVVVDDDGIIWAGTFNGLNKIKLTKQGPVVLQVLGTLQGLPSNNIWSLATSGNALWVGTDKGLCLLDRSKIKINEVQPYMHITGFQVDEVNTTLMDHYEFEHDQNYFVIEYTGIAYKNAGNLDYEYKLEGLDKKWLQTKTRTVRYNKLDPGDYTFRIKAANEDGIWSKTATMSFTILPPYWQTWWFRALALSLLVLVLGAGFRFRINRIREIADNKHRMVELELKSLRAQMNPHFTFNSLISIQRFIMDNDILKANDYLSDFASLIRRVLENSRAGSITLKDELETLKMYLDLERLRFKEKLAYNISIAPGIDQEDIEMPPNIIQPYVENAIVHGIMHRLDETKNQKTMQENNYQGLVKIDVRLEGKNLICMIEDNGIGRKKAAEINSRDTSKRKSFGMEITQERLDLLKSEKGDGMEISITDLEDDKGNPSGTRVTIRIPIENHQS